MSVWFITGASRGFGIEITRQALGRGDQVAATARHPEAITQAIPDAGDALLALPLDATSAGQRDLDLHRLPHLTDMTGTAAEIIQRREQGPGQQDRLNAQARSRER